MFSLEHRPGGRRYVVRLVRPVEPARRGVLAQSVAKQLGIAEANVDAILARRPGPLTKPISEAAAHRIVGALLEHGIEADLLPWEAAAGPASRESQVRAPRSHDKMVLVSLAGGELPMPKAGLTPDVISQKFVRPATEPRRPMTNPDAFRENPVAISPSSRVSREQTHSSLPVKKSPELSASAETVGTRLGKDARARLSGKGADSGKPHENSGPARGTEPRLSEVVIWSDEVLSSQAVSTQIDPEGRDPSQSRQVSLWPAWLYLAAFAALVQFSLHFNVSYGSWFLAALVLVLVMHASRVVGRHPVADLYTAMVALPLLLLLPVLVAAVQPWSDLARGLRLTVTSLFLLVGTLTTARVLGYDVRDIGLGLWLHRLADRWPTRPFLVAGLIFLGLFVTQLLVQSAIALTGAGLAALEISLLSAPALSTLSIPSAPTSLQIALLLVLIALVEELLFRGVLQTAAVRALGAWQGILFAALCSGLLYLAAASALHAGVMLFVGLFFGIAVYATGSLVGVGLSHALANLVLFGFLPNPATCAGEGIILGIKCWLPATRRAIEQLVGG